MTESCRIDKEGCVAESRYYADGEDWLNLCQRVAKAVSRYENNNGKWEDEFFNLVHSRAFVPAGRILRNSGKLKRNLLNCFVIPIDDNIESIGDCIRDSLITWSTGGGVGINFSGLRPIGAPIKGKGGNSSGLVSFMEAIDGVASTIESGGQRRAAAIAIIDVSHPEVNKFIDAKLKHGKLRHFNISVAISDRFLEAVERDDNWDLKFRQEVFETVRARDLWNKILKNMIESAEPGLVNWNQLIKTNSYYFAPILATNPCGELPLSAYGSCDLGSLNLAYFVSDGGSTRWQELEEAIRVAVRFLDNVIDMTTFPVPQMKNVAEEGRRIGLGVMGLADYFFKKKIRYGSEKSFAEIENLFKFLRNKAYEASIQLAKDKSPFPKFNPVDYGKASFIRKLPARIRRDIKDFGIRNVSLLTCAPTGTTSLVTGVTSGIEPLFSKAYVRDDRIGKRIYVHPVYEDLLRNKKKIPEWFVDSHDLTPEEHFETQALIQKYIDGSISKTINLPHGTKIDQLSDWLLEYAYELKGVTIYVDKSRKEQVLYPISKKEAIEYVNSQADN